MPVVAPVKSIPSLLALSLLAVSTAIAQTVFDGFSDATNWNLNPAWQQGTSSFTITGGRLDYLSANPVANSNNNAAITWLPATYSYLTSWEAQVDVHARPVSSSNPNETVLGTGYYFYGSLSAVGNSYAGGTPNVMSAAIMRPSGTTQAFQISYYLMGQRYEKPSNQLGVPYPATAVNSTTDAALRLTFNSTTKVLTAYYDADGAASGYTWVPIASIDIDSDMNTVTAGTQNWGMTNSDAFTLALEATSGNNVYVNGDVWFDNFSVTVIPEPSTYAALSGLVALGLAAHRKRGRRLG